MTMPTPDATTLVLAAVGSAVAVLGILSWKLGQRKKARLAKEESK